MPEFTWEAVNEQGQTVRGSHSAAALPEVVLHLRKSRLLPIKVQAAGGAPSVPASAPPGGALPGPAAAGQAAAVAAAPGVTALKKGRITSADILAMTSELAIMMRAGLSLDNALRVLAEMSHKEQMLSMQQALLKDVKAGQALSQALQKYPRHFGEFHINMVRSGEASGQMSAVLDRLVEHLLRQKALRDSVLSATIYPAILLVISILSLVAMLGFVVPQFEQLFEDMGDALPLPTQFVMALGHGFRHYGIYLLVAAGAGLWFLLRWLKSPRGQQRWQDLILRLPGLGGLVRKYQLTLFARSLGTLLSNGIVLLSALRIAADTVSHLSVRQSLQAMTPLVKEGQRLHLAAGRSGQFHPLALNLVRVGEETGRLGDMMLELSDILNREVENTIKRLLTLLEPALILVLGGLISAIIVSVLLGILSVNDLAA